MDLMSPFTDDSGLISSQRNENKSKFTCIPIGLTQGQFNLSVFKIPEESKWFQSRSACLMAFGYLYIQDPLKWSSQTINTVLIHGAKVVKDNYMRVKEDGPLECLLMVENYIAKIRMEEPKLLNIVESNATLIETLQTFFNEQQHGLFRCLNLCYLIWKTNGIHFLFDPQGNGSSPDDKNGFACLVCAESLKDVSKLLKTISSLKPDDCYSITAIKMKHFRKGLSEFTRPRIEYAGTNTYTIVSDCFAILSGKFHVGHKCFQSFKNRQSMAVGLMALIYNEIQPSNSWNSQLIDKVILLGTKLFHESKKTPQGEVTIHHLPREYCVLEYKFKMDYKPYDHSGQMSYSLDEMKKNLLMYLQRAFQGSTTKSVLIQTNSLLFAVWESNDYYYIFDAYARNGNGAISDDQSGMPCIQMHGNLESLCAVLCTNLNAIASSDGFVLHGVNVTLQCNSGEKVTDSDLESINTFMDELFWVELNSFQESSARSEEICNLDDSSDDDIFMETVGGVKRAVSSVGSSESRSTTSFVSESGGSDGRTESSSNNDDSATQSNDDSSSQASKSMKYRRDFKEENEPDADQVDSDKKKIKGRKIKQEKDAEDDDIFENVERSQPKKKKGKKVKLEKEDEKEDNFENVERSQQDDADKQSGKKTKGKHKSKNKGQTTNGAEKQSLVVVESSSGTAASITKLLNTSFKISDRVLLVTEWGDFFVVQDTNVYFLCDGCLCDQNALIQMNLTELVSSTKLDSIDGVVEKIMTAKLEPKIDQEYELGNARTDADVAFSRDFSCSVDASFWELIEGMIELMKTTAKFDKIKNDLV